MRTRRRTTTVVLGIAGLALVLAWTAAPIRAAGAQNVKCHSGDILEGTYNNVEVPKGNFCLLLGATVLHNVIANGAQQLGIDNSKIGGNVEAHHVTDNGWLCGSTVGGNVDVSNSGQSTAEPGSWFIGDASWCTPQFDPVPGNYIGGSLHFNNNASGGSISNNDIEHDLACEHNTPPPTGTNNSVDHKATGQCAALAGGVDDSSSPPDSD
jgi:hypothetical protein